MALPLNPFRAFIHLARFYGEGGVIVDDRPHLWTLVQPDGDVVARIARSFYALDPARQEALLRRHLARIGTIREAIASLRRLVQALPGYAWLPVAATLVGGGTVLSWEWLIGLLAASGGLGAGMRFARPLVIGGGLRFLRWTARRAVRRRFRGLAGPD